MPAEQLLAGMQAALRVGSSDPQVVLIEARRAGGTTDPTVVPLDAGLARYDRPAPGLSGYDDLLKKRNTA